MIQLVILFGVHLRVARYQSSTDTQSRPPVSVLIAARNEEKNLRENLPLILSQNYPEFQVIVVNHASYDGTGELLEELKAEHPNLHIINLPEGRVSDGGKKLAITLGMKGALHDRVLLTDADCKPPGSDWIQSMVSKAHKPDDIILGYSPYEKESGLLNALIRFDGLFTAMNYLGFALSGMPYMGVGRNLSYSRSSFFEVGGFRSHYSIDSGDDDLLINQIARKENVRISPEPLSHTLTKAKTSWKSYLRQKRRHLSTSWYYRPLHRRLLALQALSLMLFYICGAVLIAMAVYPLLITGVIVLRLLAVALIFRAASRYLRHKDLAFFAPLLELLILVFNSLAHLANATTKKTRWKT